MSIKAKIALYEPGMENPEKYFSLRIKQELSNEPSVYSKPSKLFIVLNINGDFQAFQRLLIKTGIIDKKYRWIFEDGHLVVLGNCFDYYEQIIDCLWLIYGLEEKARRKGGDVHYILGRQEILHLNGVWRHTQPRYASNTKSSSYVALYDGNNELWRWLHTKNIIERAGNILFVNGNIADGISQLNLSLKEINNLARSFYHQVQALLSNPSLKSIFNDDWPSEWDQEVEARVNTVLSRFGVSTIITSHLLWNQTTDPIDRKPTVNMYSLPSQLAGLIVKNDKFYHVHSEGQRKRIS